MCLQYKSRFWGCQHDARFFFRLPPARRYIRSRLYFMSAVTAASLFVPGALKKVLITVCTLRCKEGRFTSSFRFCIRFDCDDPGHSKFTFLFVCKIGPNVRNGMKITCWPASEATSFEIGQKCVGPSVVLSVCLATSCYRCRLLYRSLWFSNEWIHFWCNPFSSTKNE